MEDWRATMHDPIHYKVFEALTDETWEYRTVDGISRETGYPQHDVLSIIRTYPTLIREARVPTPDGRALYRLRERGETDEEKRAEVLAFAASSY